MSSHGRFLTDFERISGSVAGKEGTFVIQHSGSFRGVKRAVSGSLLKGVATRQRLLERLGHTPPAEAEQAYYAFIVNGDLAA